MRPGQILAMTTIAPLAISLVALGCDKITPESRAHQPSSPAPEVAAEETSPEVATRPASNPPTRLSTEDRGIFADLDDEVTLTFPSWLEPEPVLVMKAPGSEAMYTYIDGAFVGLGDASLGPVIQVESFGDHDHDGDNIPDSLDVMIGARKTELNSADYKGGYEELSYPGGDVSRDRGVCTDVVIRAVRNAGVDLQVELYKDIKRSPRSFPMVKKANPHIDQRRVKTILPYFERNWRALPTDPEDSSSPWLPGDILFMQIKGDARPDHMGLVSDKLGPSGLPLVINNWTDGYSTAAIDILSYVPVTHRFRPKVRGLRVEAKHQGLEGVLARQAVSLPPETSQVLLVTATFNDSRRGELRRYERDGEVWAQIGEPIDVMLGAKGLGRGRGLHDAMEGGAIRTARPKVEGDRRAPVGVFTLGTAFGRGARAPYAKDGKGWPYRAVTGEDYFVDDPASEHYNTWRVGEGAWESAEEMSMYRLGLVVEHNMGPAKPGAGSAIFLHDSDMSSPTLGCTAMRERELAGVLAWLDPGKKPLLLQVADEVFSGE